MSETTYSLFQQGRAQLKRGMAAQATVALEKAKRREPEKASIREALGIAYFRIGRWEEAEAEFRKLLELSPVNDYAHYALGRMPREAGPRPRGERALQARELAVARLERSTGRGSRTSTRARRARSPVTRRISSSDEMPASASRMPSWRERRHALLDRLGEDLLGRAGLDQPAQPALHRHHLVERDAAGDSPCPRTARSRRAVEPGSSIGVARCRAPRARARPAEYGSRQCDAEPAREPLGDDAVDRRREQARLDAHVDEARDRRRGVVRVQRRQHEMARHRGLDRDPRRLLVADLADEQHVGIGAEDRAQAAREREPALRS